MFSYNITEGWQEIEDFLANTQVDDFSNELVTAGYSSVYSGQLGNEFTFFNTEVYIKDNAKKESIAPYDFIVMVDLGRFIESIAVNDFPSLVELLSKLSTISGTALFSDLEKEKLQNI